MKLSVSYIVRNEEKNIARSLDSVKFANQIVIVDTGSTDGTIDAINKWHNSLGIINKPVLKLLIKEWTNFADCRNYSLDNCTGSHILIMDADETLRQPEALDKLLNDPDNIDAWSVIQLDKCGQMCYTFRLIKSDLRYKVNEAQDIIHENIDIDGKKIGYSDLIIDHHKELTPEEHSNKIDNIMSVFGSIPTGLKKDYYEGVYALWSGNHRVGFEKLNHCIDKVSPQLQAFIYLMVGHYYNILSTTYGIEALYFYNKSLETAPEQNEGHIKMAEYYASIGDNRNALQSLQKVRARTNRLKTEMQNDKYYTNEQIDLRIKQISERNIGA